MIPFELSPSDSNPQQRFSIHGDSVRHEVRAAGLHGLLELPLPSDAAGLAAPIAWRRAWLRGKRPVRIVPTCARRSLQLVDLFSGSGGLSLGVCEGLRSLGFDIETALAVDRDPVGLEIYARNFGPRRTLSRECESLVDYKIDGRGAEATWSFKPTLTDTKFANVLRNVDVLVGGPPCQGHSNLNNYTRRRDPRNQLYLVMPAIAAALNVPIVIIENVPDVKADHSEVVETALALFQSTGYQVQHGVLNASQLGAAQKRRRHFVIAVHGTFAFPRFKDLLRGLLLPPAPISEALVDLLGVCGTSEFDSGATLSRDNQDRIKFLFENELYELPDAQRPECHREGHTYPSVYGRMHWDRPCGTITTGFMTPGRGRYVHAQEPRGLTLREGARLQGFPDWFQFLNTAGVMPSKKSLSKAIGDAVPPTLGFAAALIAAAVSPTLQANAVAERPLLAYG